MIEALQEQQGWHRDQSRTVLHRIRYHSVQDSPPQDQVPLSPGQSSTGPSTTQARTVLHRTRYHSVQDSPPQDQVPLSPGQLLLTRPGTSQVLRGRLTIASRTGTQKDKLKLSAGQLLIGKGKTQSRTVTVLTGQGTTEFMKVPHMTS